MNRTKLFLTVTLFVVVIGLVGYGWWYQQQLSDKSSMEQIEIPEGPMQVQLVISGFTQPHVTFEFEKSITPLEYLEFINKNDDRVNLQTQTYEDMGVIVTSMLGKTNGQQNRYWQYFVNGKQPMLAADQYYLADGDVLEWKFIPSEF